MCMTDEFFALTSAIRAKKDAAYWRNRAACLVTDLDFTREDLVAIAASMATKAQAAEEARSRKGAATICAVGAEEPSQGHAF
jgi:hypothetical protein